MPSTDLRNNGSRNLRQGRFSAGATQAHAGEDFDAFVARADAALYRAKHEGRNRLVVG